MVKMTKEPRVYRLAQTETNHMAMVRMLEDIGADGKTWMANQTAPSGSELISEVAGRLCYKSFEVGLNPNVTRTREGNKPYIGNILKSQHGSVLEHGSVSFGFIGVSRVFTHEIVRHRVGTAFSQESLRFVRFDEIPMWIPPLIGNDGRVHIEGGTQAARDYTKGEIAQREIFDGMTVSEKLYTRLGEIFGVEDEGLAFAVKKKLTSAFRRIAPIGLSTNIIVTANHRTWRHIIEQRTSIHAEEELRMVVGNVARDLQSNFPNIYQDMIEEEDPETGVPSYRFENHKI